MTDTPSLQVSDDQAAAVQKTPNRVTLASLNAKVIDVEYIYPETAPDFTICVIKMENGFVSMGTSRAVDPENFNRELGQTYAMEAALRNVWPMEGYLLAEKMKAA